MLEKENIQAGWFRSDQLLRAIPYVGIETLEQATSGVSVSKRGASGGIENNICNRLLVRPSKGRIFSGRLYNLVIIRLNSHSKPSPEECAKKYVLNQTRVGDYFTVLSKKSRFVNIV